MKMIAKDSQYEAVPAQSKGNLATAARFKTQFVSTELEDSALMDEDGDDPLSRAQMLASIRAAKRLHLPTEEALRAVRRQIDED